MKVQPDGMAMAKLTDPRFCSGPTPASPAFAAGAEAHPRAAARWAAMVSEVEVNQDTGKVTVKRIFFANDSGPISNPDGLRNQIEGGALQGMSRAMGEEVTWDEQKVTSVDWQSYHSLPLGFDVPEIQVKLINRPDEPATGAGETSITIVAAAIGNAIFDATGARIRQVPFTPARMKAALSESLSKA